MSEAEVDTKETVNLKKDWVDKLSEIGKKIFDKTVAIGKFAFLVASIYYAAKWIFKYILVPILVFFTLKQFCILGGAKWIDHVYITYLIAIWVLFMYVGHAVFHLFFTEVTKEEAEAIAVRKSRGRW